MHIKCGENCMNCSLVFIFYILLYIHNLHVYIQNMANKNFEIGNVTAAFFCSCPIPCTRVENIALKSRCNNVQNTFQILCCPHTLFFMPQQHLCVPNVRTLVPWSFECYPSPPLLSFHNRHVHDRENFWWHTTVKRTSAVSPTVSSDRISSVFCPLNSTSCGRWWWWWWWCCRDAVTRAKLMLKLRPNQPTYLSRINLLKITQCCQRLSDGFVGLRYIYCNLVIEDTEKRFALIKSWMERGVGVKFLTF